MLRDHRTQFFISVHFTRYLDGAAVRLAIDAKKNRGLSIGGDDCEDGLADG
jgi:hypothetical protein